MEPSHGESVPAEAAVVPRTCRVGRERESTSNKSDISSALRILTPLMETPDPPNHTPWCLKTCDFDTP